MKTSLQKKIRKTSTNIFRSLFRLESVEVGISVITQCVNSCSSCSHSEVVALSEAPGKSLLYFTVLKGYSLRIFKGE